MRRIAIVFLTALSLITLVMIIDSVRSRDQTIAIGMGRTMRIDSDNRQWVWHTGGFSRYEVSLRPLSLDFTYTPSTMQRAIGFQIPLVALFAVFVLYPIVAFLRQSSEGKHPRDVSILVAVVVFLVVWHISGDVTIRLFYAYYPWFSNDYFLLESAIKLAGLAITTLLALYVAKRTRVFVRAHHRRSIGACATCGYDLTGNTSGTCPECGIDVV